MNLRVKVAIGQQRVRIINSKFREVYAGPVQSMKIDDRKSNRSIDDNRLIIVN